MTQTLEKYEQLAMPNLDIEGHAGFSLAHISECFSGEKVYPCAMAAFSDTKYRHSSLDPLPDAYVPVWFSTPEHNFGHVMIWDPNKRMLFGTPRSDYGAQYFTFENIVNAKTFYLGWSEDIAGVRVVRKGA